MIKKTIYCSSTCRIGLFGGTFNPIHIGHVKMAKAALKQFKLDKIYFIPCGIPPHKPTKTMLPAKLRYKLVKKAIRKNKHFKVLDIEIKKKKKCYTIDTIKTFVGNSRDCSLLYFLIGQDEFEALHTWKKSAGLATLVTFLVLPRSLKKIKPPKIKDLKWLSVHTKLIDISSTAIRNSFN